MRSIWQTLKMLIVAGGCWSAVVGTAWAQRKPAEENVGGEAAPSAWAMPYILVILGIGLGMLVVLRTSRRRDRAKPQTYDAKYGEDEGDEDE